IDTIGGDAPGKIGAGKTYLLFFEGKGDAHFGVIGENSGRLFGEHDALLERCTAVGATERNAGARKPIERIKVCRRRLPVGALIAIGVHLQVFGEWDGPVAQRGDVGKYVAFEPWSDDGVEVLPVDLRAGAGGPLDGGLKLGNDDLEAMGLRE